MYFVISDHFSAACTYSDQRWTIDTPTIEVVGFLLHFIGAHLIVSMGVSKQLLCHERATGHLSWSYGQAWAIRLPCICFYRTNPAPFSYSNGGCSLVPE